MLPIIGQRVDEVKVGKLAGSSGTPRRFYAAIERIRKEVKRRFGRCVFEVEGARVNEELTSHSLDALHDKAVAFELMRAGAKSPEHCWELLRLVEERLGKLHKQRRIAVLGPK